jgi:hypothetical protein
MRARELEETLNTGEFMGRRLVWRDWYARSHVMVLAQSVQRLGQIGVTIQQITSDITGSSRLPSSPPAIEAFRASLQMHVARRIADHRRPDGEERIRAKLGRWRLHGPAAHTARRVYARLRSLGGLVTPRVAAACFSVIWNRWTTARRLQKRGRAENYCVLGCGGGAEDSIEHYCRCRAVRLTGAKFLRIWPDIDLESFMLADARICDDEALISVAVLVYATYRSTNHFRPRGGTDHETACDAMEQFCRRGVEDHALSRRVIDNRWTSSSMGQRSKRRRT